MANHGRFLCAALLSVGLLGCVGQRPLPRAEVLPEPMAIACENPLFLAQGPEGYPVVFNRVHAAVNAYFPIARSNIYAGTIESEPVITAGFWDCIRYDRYSFDQLLESAAQTIRRRVLVTITPAESGGYFVELQVLKELEDLPSPRHAAAGKSVFRYEAPTERVSDVVDFPNVTRGWIPLGRDPEMEQLILGRVKRGC